MESGSLSLREFNKKRIKNRPNLNLEKIYQNDNYLIQTLKRTKRVTIENPVDIFEHNLQRLLKKIYKEIKFLNDPIIKEINNENNNFQSDYNRLLEKFQNNTSVIFQDLINLYKNKGYKIPYLNCDHNLFKVNPLIEENTNKIIHYFLLQRNVKTKKEILLIKSLVFLRKLNKLIVNNNKIKKKNEKNISIDISDNKNTIEDIEELKKSIREIIRLIESYTKVDENDSKINKTRLKFNTKMRTLNIKGKSSKVLINHNLISSNRNNKSKIIFLDKIKDDIIHKSSRELTHENFFPYDDEKSNTLKNINIPKRGISSREIKRRKKTFNTYKQNKEQNNYLKNNIIEINDKFYKSEKRGEISKILYNNTFENSNKKLNINLNSKKFYKTLNNFKSLNKTDKINKGSLPLFIRTQTVEKKDNEKGLNKKRINLERSRNFFNTSLFTNKTEFFNFAYKRLKKGNFEDIDKYVKKYLNEVECKSNEEIYNTISRYDYKNFQNNLNEIETFIKKSDLDRKTEKIYLNSFISRRVANSLKNMREKESQISKFNKIITTIGNVKNK